MKDKNLIIKRISQIVGIVTIAFSLVIAVIYYLNVKDADALSPLIDLSMNWALILVLVAIAFAFLVGPIVSIISNPKSLIKGMISVGVLVLIVVIAYTTSSGDVSTVQLNYNIENLQSQLIFTETGLATLVIVVGLAFLAVIVLELKSLLKL